MNNLRNGSNSCSGGGIRMLFQPWKGFYYYCGRHMLNI